MITTFLSLEDILEFIAFLRLNGFKLSADQNALYEMVLDVAQGNLDKPAIANFLRQHTQPAPN